MKLAILALTRGGKNLGVKLVQNLPYKNADLFVLERFKTEEREKIIKGRFMEFVRRIFFKYDGFIFIMAAGIVVRAISPLIRDKRTDPAVVVVDEKGKHAISLLGGHLGGANTLAEMVAESTGGEAVITTATDVNNTMAVDVLAEELGLSIEDFENVKHINSAIVNGDLIGLYTEININRKLPPNIKLIGLKDELKELTGLVLISNRTDLPCYNLPSVVLRPKNLIAGVGCRKGKGKDEIIGAIKQVLALNNLSNKSLKAIATIDIKKDEAGIIEASRFFNVPLKFFSKQNIREIEGNFNGSSFVKQKLGISCVAEPCAFLAAAKPVKIYNKQKFDGITVALAVDGSENG
jgi:cobalt-precorrin 5A hydrolase